MLAPGEKTPRWTKKNLMWAEWWDGGGGCGGEGQASIIVNHMTNLIAAEQVRRKLNPFQHPSHIGSHHGPKRAA